MPLPSNRPASDIVVDTQLENVSVESSAFAVATHRGRIHKIYGALQDTITGDPATITFKINGTALDGVTLTVTGAAGTTFQSDENGSPTRGYVDQGDTLEFASSGGSTGAAALNLAVIIAQM